jgi:single-strand DNA-binding protein
MSSLNKVFILGRLGKDPEIRHTADGSVVASFSVATSTSSVKNGEKREYTEWHNCAAFNKAGEVAQNYLKKGNQVLVEGSLRTSKWEDNGQMKYKTEIVVGRLTMLGGKSDTKEPDQEPNGNIAAMDDDIPF